MLGLWWRKLQASFKTFHPERRATEQTVGPQPWEQLVTEGHVRAARLRMTAPYIIGMGVIAAAVGVYGLMIIPLPSSLPSIVQYHRAAEALQKRLQEFKAPVLEPFQAFAYAPSITMEQIQSLPPASELPKVIELLRTSLEESGSYPKDLVNSIKEIDPPTFWQAKWPVESIVTVNKGDLRAFGAIVTLNATKQYSGTPVRWIGIFKRTSQGWLVVSIKYQGMVVLSGLPAVAPDELYVSLKTLMGIP